MIYDKFLRRLSRKTTSGRFIAEIDGLRFISIAFVVLFHISGYLATRAQIAWPIPPANHPVGWLASHGHFGVQLFFVISGFVLSLPFAAYRLGYGQPIRLRAYFLRRVTRLEPPYIVAMTGFFLILAARASTNVSELFAHYLASLGYVHNLVFGTSSTINVVAWSLEIEVQFYLLAPLLTTVFWIRGRVFRRVLIALCAVLFGLAQWRYVPDGSRLGLSWLNHAQYFLMGFLLTDVFLVDWRERPLREWKWDFAFVAAWPAMLVAWQSPLSMRVVFPFLILLAFLATFRGRTTSTVLSNPWITVIGGMCYTIYLLHYPFISFVGPFTTALTVGKDFGLNLLIQLSLIAPLLLGVSTIYFVLVERPCMERDWPQRFARWVQRIRFATSTAPRSDARVDQTR